MLVGAAEGALATVRTYAHVGAGAPVATAAAGAMLLPVLANLSHAFMHILNQTEVVGGEKLDAAVRRRPEGQPLITICNHVAAMDDPLVLAAALPPVALLDARAMRWILCATDRCFKSPAAALFFRSLRVLPVERGAGVEQEGMDAALANLDSGGWVHIFPEGSRSRDGGRTLQPIRRGVGRLVADAAVPPLLLPLVHGGMEAVLPPGSKSPAVGKMVTVVVGDPIEIEDLLAVHHAAGGPKSELLDAIAARVASRMAKLKTEVDARVAARSRALEVIPIRPAAALSRAEALWEHADWEACGALSAVDVQLGGIHKACIHEAGVRQSSLPASALHSQPVVERELDGAARAALPEHQESRCRDDEHFANSLQPPQAQLEGAGCALAEPGAQSPEIRGQELTMSRADTGATPAAVAGIAGPTEGGVGALLPESDEPSNAESTWLPQPWSGEDPFAFSYRLPASSCLMPSFAARGLLETLQRASGAASSQLAGVATLGLGTAWATRASTSDHLRHPLCFESAMPAMMDEGPA
eukprot:SM000142S00549  [mRNA]  locus=s142:311778:313800:- [translate_table: standard]